MATRGHRHGPIRRYSRGVQRRIKLVLVRALRLRCSAHCIGLSAAFGVGVAIGIPVGLQTAFALLFGWLFKLNLPMVLLGTMFANPLTIVPIYGLIVWLGTALTGISFSMERFTVLLSAPTPANFIALGLDGLAVFFAGALPPALLAGSIVYFPARNLAEMYVSRMKLRGDRRRLRKSEKNLNTILTTEPPIH